MGNRLQGLCSMSMSIDQATQTDQSSHNGWNRGWGSKPGDFFQQCLSSEKWMAYYTNTSPASFRSLCDAMKPLLKSNKSFPNVSQEEQLFIALVKLTHNLDHMDLSFRFGLSLADVSRCMTAWICTLLVNRRLFDSYAVCREKKWLLASVSCQ